MFDINKYKGMDIEEVMMDEDFSEEEMIAEHIRELEANGEYDKAKEIKEALNIDYDAAARHFARCVLEKEGVFYAAENEFQKRYDKKEYSKCERK